MGLCDFFKKEPDRPTVHVEDFEIIQTDVHVKERGNYKTKTGNPRGLIVHFTAGHNNPVGTLNSLSSRGLSCLVMDDAGKVYRAKNQALNDVGYHAGNSKIHGYSGASLYCMGMEICNAGELTLYKGKYYPWWCFDSKKNFKGGKSIPEDQIRFITKNADNYRIGAFHKYTSEQEESLVKFCLWQLKVNPEFKIDWIMGHDEVAVPLGRKSDPGGSLSLTMPDFREFLRIKYRGGE